MCICKNPARINVCGLRFLFLDLRVSLRIRKPLLSKFQNEDGSANGNFNRSDELDDRTMKTKKNTQSIEEQV